MKARLFILVTALAALSIQATAQDKQPASPATQQVARGRAWVDANNDGICDKFNAPAGQGQRYRRDHRQGRPCDGTARGRDNRQMAHQGNTPRQGYGRGPRNF